jgi:purine-cytosine permease-like protein
MGYWPSKICAILNMVIMLGYGMIDCLVGGQILSAVADGKMTVIVGIVIIALISWLVVVFGMSTFQVYERSGYPHFSIFPNIIIN